MPIQPVPASVMAHDAGVIGEYERPRPAKLQKFAADVAIWSEHYPQIQPASSAFTAAVEAYANRSTHKHWQEVIRTIRALVPLFEQLGDVTVGLES